MLTFEELSSKFLTWCKAHQSEGTHKWYLNYLKMFCAYPGIAALPAYELKPWQVQEWIDSHGARWGANYRGGAVIAVKRVFHWAEELGHGEGNPVKKLKKPSPQRRKIYMKPADYEQMLALIKPGDPFRDLFTFAWVTGARPQEIRHIEQRHIFLDRKRIVFPAEESKGKRNERVIRLNMVALEIVERLLVLHPDGKLFRNTHGDPWSKFALCERHAEMKKKTGKALSPYTMRHGFVTRKLISGVDAITLSKLTGHEDATMISKIYSHVEDDDEHMSKAIEG